MTPEAYIGEILIRVGLSVLACGLATAAMIIAVRTRTTDYPTKLAKSLAELDADVTGFDLKINTIMEELRSMRASIAAQARHYKGHADPAGTAAAPAAAAAAPWNVAPDLWKRMNDVQRAGLKAAGIGPGTNGRG